MANNTFCDGSYFRENLSTRESLDGRARCPVCGRVLNVRVATLRNDRYEATLPRHKNVRRFDHRERKHHIRERPRNEDA